jgi:hypothetical protein
MASPKLSKLAGTLAPDAARVEFLEEAVSRSELAQEPACPNCTSEVNMPAKEGFKNLHKQCLLCYITCAGSNAPGNKRLCDPLLLEGVADIVFFGASHFTQQNNHLDLRVGLVAHNVVHEVSAGVTISTNGHSLVDTISSLGDDVVQFVGHATRSRDVGNTGQQTSCKY